MAKLTASLRCRDRGTASAPPWRSKAAPSWSVPQRRRRRLLRGLGLRLPHERRRRHVRRSGQADGRRCRVVRLLRRLRGDRRRHRRDRSRRRSATAARQYELDSGSVYVFREEGSGGAAGAATASVGLIVGLVVAAAVAVVLGYLALNRFRSQSRASEQAWAADAEDIKLEAAFSDAADASMAAAEPSTLRPAGRALKKSSPPLPSPPHTWNRRTPLRSKVARPFAPAPAGAPRRARRSACGHRAVHGVSARLSPQRCERARAPGAPAQLARRPARGRRPRGGRRARPARRPGAQSRRRPAPGGPPRTPAGAVARRRAGPARRRTRPRRGRTART